MRLALISIWIAATMAVYAADPPSMKEGLWAIHSEVVQHPSERKATNPSVTLCRDAAYDKRVREAKMPKGKCEPAVDKSVGSTKIFETTCTVGAATVTVTETIETTGDTAAHTVTDSRIVPAVGGISGMTVTADMKYMSACPAGMKPGDAVLPDGTIGHLPVP